MTDFLSSTISLFVIFTKNSIGCLNSPYVTYRSLSDNKTSAKQTIFILIFSILYFLFATLLRVGLSNPYFLTLKFNILTIASIVTFLIVVCFLTILSKITQKGNPKTLFILWSYTLLPTLTWFFVTSLMYYFLPPPRTISIWGKMFSFLFIAFSITMLFWKIILYYLTLRFGLKMDLQKIFFTTIILTPLFSIFSITMYRLGIFKIPFV